MNLHILTCTNQIQSHVSDVILVQSLCCVSAYKKLQSDCSRSAYLSGVPVACRLLCYGDNFRVPSTLDSRSNESV